MWKKRKDGCEELGESLAPVMVLNRSLDWTFRKEHVTLGKQQDPSTALPLSRLSAVL